MVVFEEGGFTHTEPHPDSFIRLPPVQHQGDCNGCMFVATAELMGIILAWQEKTDYIPLSAQNLLDHVILHNYGWYKKKFKDTKNILDLPVFPGHVYDYAKRQGICAATGEHVYRGRRNRHPPNLRKCFPKYKLRSFNDYTNLPRNEPKLIRCINKTPILGLMKVALSDGARLEKLKKGEIYRNVSKPGEKVEGHTMIIVGHTEVGDIKVYYVKNSWGARWCNEGFGMVERSCFYLFTIFKGVKIDNGPPAMLAGH